MGLAREFGTYIGPEQQLISLEDPLQATSL